MEPDPPVFVIDLRAHPAAHEAEAPTVAAEALEADETVALVALLHDGADEPLVLPIEPTRDLVMLDALARLLRFAVERGEPPIRVAERYGGATERRLLFERRLPGWALAGIEPARARALPPRLRAILGSRADRG